MLNSVVPGEISSGIHFKIHGLMNYKCEYGDLVFLKAAVYSVLSYHTIILIWGGKYTEATKPKVSN